ncbi:WD40/YVTN/BNR-like repeat-containing protein [Ketobacter sp.]|uniref:WD40/YVTN/BNR-like repeat-containing protein n=1 Tax=Ketobacter sp. TaxID=2083498 RepID=UPI0025BCD112|nr:YCF48-related protein [Ketobacter sp.]
MRDSMMKQVVGAALLCCGMASATSAADYEKYLDLRAAIPSDKAAESLLTDVDVFQNTVIMVGDRGHILVSSDNGEQWTQAEVPVQYLLTAVDFGSENKVWAVGHEGVILHSADAGKTWQLQYANPHRVRTDEELNQLTDEEFTKLPQAGSPLLDVWFRDELVGFAVGAYGMFLGTEDGGKTWNDVSSRIENYDGWHLNSIAAGEDGVVYIAGEKGVLFRSDDGGENWTTLTGPYQGSYFGVLVGPMPDDVFLFGLQGNIFKSSDRGETWTKAKSKASDGLMDGVLLGSQGVMLVGNSGVILTSQDGGASFSMQITKSREALLAIRKLPNGKLIMVGQGGVQVVAPSTK